MTSTPVPPAPPVPPVLPPARPPRKRSATGLLVGLTLVALVLFAASIGVVVWAVNASKHADVDSGTFLKVPLSGALADAPSTPGLFDDPDGAPATVTEMAEAIRRASDDSRISGLYLVLDAPQGGWADYQELRAAVEAFGEAGKPCVAYSPSAITNGAYYLASACDTIALAPAALSLVTGLSIEVSYYKDTLAKLGIEPEYEHVGDFKSAIEVFERTGPSAPAAQAYEAMLDALYGDMVAGIAAGRGISEADVRAFIDTPTLTPKDMLDRGMIDLLAWPDAMAAHVHQVRQDDFADLLAAPVTDKDTKHLTPLKEYIKDQRAEESGRGAAIAVIYAEGNIVSGDGTPSLFGDDGQLTDGKYARWMRQVREDDDIKAVVVRVNSPGGSALASSLMWRENARTIAAGKPVVVSMGDYAASGGYLMSANAERIFAEPGTLTGSIGVFAGKFDLSGTYDKLGIHTHAFQRGAMAGMLSMSTGFTDDERTVFRAYIADFYDQFLDVVAEGRHMDRDAVHVVAQGRVWTGTQALERGLVDELGTLQDAVAHAATLVSLDDYHVERLPRRQTFFELLVDDLSDARAPTIRVELPLPLDAATLRDLATLERIQQDGGAAAFLPGHPTVR
ncbi:MAG: signal peptide peptidase SppA [Alphaproteobacteria bacterium]|nr:signal peptide peptidase SppA [Alphaproteobacteria bacterium]